MNIDNDIKTNLLSNYVNQYIQPAQSFTVDDDDNSISENKNRKTTKLVLPQSIIRQCIYNYRLKSVEPHNGYIHCNNDNDNDNYNGNTNTYINTQYGILQYNKQHNLYNIHRISSNYIPQINDLVIGTIIHKSNENYRISLGSQCTYNAVMSYYSFPGSSKRNHPNLHVGSLVYCIVNDIHIQNNDTTIVLSCISSYIQQRDYVSGDNIFGELHRGISFNVSQQLVYTLLQPQCYILTIIDNMLHIQYEICIGMNGVVWINSDSIANTIIVMNLIVKTQNMNKQQIKQEISNFAKRTQLQHNNDIV